MFMSMSPGSWSGASFTELHCLGCVCGTVSQACVVSWLFLFVLGHFDINKKWVD